MTMLAELPVESWRAHRDTSRRNAIAEYYLPIIEMTAYYMERRYGAVSGLDKGDFLGYGAEGLMQAIEKYDPEQGVPFYAYAQKRVRGAVIDALRRNDGLSRNARKVRAAVLEAQEHLAQQLGRHPQDSEIAEQLGISAQAVRNALQARRAGRLGGYAEMPIEERIMAHMESTAVRSALRALPEREAEVVTLKVWEGLTLVEIAAQLGMSKSRAGQLWQSGIKRLRTRLANWQD